MKVKRNNPRPLVSFDWEKYAELKRKLNLNEQSSKKKRKPKQQKQQVQKKSLARPLFDYDKCTNSSTKNIVQVVKEKSEELLETFNKIEGTFDKSRFDLPILIEKPLQILKTFFPNINDNSVLNFMLPSYFHMINIKKTLINEAGNIIIPNWFSINFMGSGDGKDKLYDTIENHLFSDIKTWFKNEATNLYEQQKKKYLMELKEQKQKKKDRSFEYLQEKALFYEKPQKPLYSILDATAEGIFVQGKIINKSDFGSIFLKFPEFGLFIMNKDQHRARFISNFMEYYSGNIPAKIIRSEDAEESIEGIPISLLGYSDITIFKNEVIKDFDTFMQTGFARRSMISFNPHKKLVADVFSKDESEKLTKMLNSYGQEIFDVFKQIMPKSVYELESDAIDILNEYHKKNIDGCNNALDPLVQKEIKSRTFKAIKLSGLFAILNHPIKTVINCTDVKQAIDTVEKLSVDFIDFLNYKPSGNETEDKLYKLFCNNIGKEFKKTDLINNYYKEIGLSRKGFRSQFDNLIKSVENKAVSEGYALIHDTSKYPNCHIFSLVEPIPSDLSDGVSQLGDLL